MNKALSPLFHLSLCTLGCLFASSTQAQVTPDDTVNTQVNPNGNVAEITGGKTRGGNLFHSFRDFSVSTGNEAFFNNATDISNIFSRVTGANISNIDGLIRANGSANLFLINPAGIIFGENASLNIGGSFYGSTASSVLFEDGEFSATDLDNSPVLTINAPIGLGFRDNPGDIVNRSVAQNPNGETNVTGNIVGLQVPNGKTLAIVGGNIVFDYGNLALSGGQITLGGLSSEGTVQLNEEGNLSFPSDVPLADVFLKNSVLDLESSQEGSISINAEKLQLSQNSFLFAGVLEKSAVNQIQPGNIEILAGNISLEDNSTIEVSTFGEGDAGNISINADSIFLDTSQIISGVGAVGIGDSGDISINTGVLSLTNGSQIETFGFGRGDTGNIQIIATQAITLDGINSDGFSSAIGTSSREGGIGNSGEIEIASKSLSLSNGAYIFAGVSGVGNAGNINIKVDDAIDIRGINNEDFSAGIVSRIFENGTGNGGNINIAAESISLADGGQISSSTDGRGDAGSLNIQAESVELSGNNDSNVSSLSTAVEKNGEGDAGNLTLATENLSVSDGATISVSTLGLGNGGNLSINAKEAITIKGSTKNNSSGFFANALINSGDGGNVDVVTNQLVIDDGGIITASNFDNLGVLKAGTGQAGSISIDANKIDLINNTSIDAGTQSSTGAGGNISLQTSEDITFKSNNSISAQAFQDANGGNIDIDTRFLIAFPNSNNSILADAQLGNGGNININTEAIFGFSLGASDPENPQDSTNTIKASSEFEGEIEFSQSYTIDIDSSNKIIPVDSKQKIAEACSTNRHLELKSGLTIKGKDGVTPAPDLPLSSENIIDGETNSAYSIPAPIETSQGKIQPARGIKVTKDGRMILTAYRTNDAGERIPEIKPNCSSALTNLEDI